ncbi:MAG: UDP-N-acetylmuramate:L-alanyl-gamma-D-glutamyl-meso-diaminopimelate ligase [Deltaproteobacteria bacterium]|nr:UDP-N-acetylmuramate:L-alanyl-gamma-D-glutamyl-meso-diaminopimelate ligase [Deltaproteobacteria bacterium]
MKIHLLGIGGTGMASLAGMLQASGHEITGSDQGIYPPMSTLLEEWKINVTCPYAEKNIPEQCDLVIIGNVISRNNPEAQEVIKRELPYLSMPETIQRFFLKDKKSLVVAGTHGKTTTTSMLSWVLEHCQQEPSFFVGGKPQNFPQNFQLKTGPYFVLEGDEYDTAFFDKGPKFLHYQPFAVILTSIEFDHADIYRDLEHVRSSFRKLMQIIPEEGLLIANIDDPEVKALLKEYPGRVVRYAMLPENRQQCDYYADLESIENNTHFSLYEKGEKKLGKFQLNIPGRHNLSNSLGVLSLCCKLGLDLKTMQEALVQFKGVKRRQEILGETNNILIIDDFAHHPSAVRETILAIHEKFPQRRLWAIFEPRSNTSKRDIFQNQYPQSFRLADQVILASVFQPEKVQSGQTLNVDKIVQEINQQMERNSEIGSQDKKAVHINNYDQLVSHLVKESQSGDILLFMSNGDFGGVARKTLENLKS